MSYIDNVKFKEILGASRNGNEKAMEIMQAMRKGSSQDDVDRLVNDYYNVTMPALPEIEKNVGGIQPIPEELLPQEVENDAVVASGDVIDLSEMLDKEMVGLIDETDFSPLSFTDYIKNKRNDANRMLKGGDYFKSFDYEGRQKYMTDKIDAYKSKFDTNLRDIERGFGDTDKALSMYLQSANDSLDDGAEFEQGKATDAYNNFTDNETVMHSFGRYWDEDDNAVIVQALKELMQEYGKANVIAALNILKSDNEGHRDYLNNEIDANIGKYSKSMQNLLK